MPHIVIGGPRRIIPLVMLARPVEQRQRLWMSGSGAASAGGASAVSNGNGGGPANGALISATERKTSGRTSAHQAATEAPKSWPTTAATERWPNAEHQCQRIPDRIQYAERMQVAVVIRAPAGRAAIAALVGGNDVKPRLGQRQHHLAPRIGDLGKPCSNSTQGWSRDANPASSTCMRSPLTLSTKRERMPGGNRRCRAAAIQSFVSPKTAPLILPPDGRHHNPVPSGLKQVGDGVPVPLHRGDVIAD